MPPLYVIYGHPLDYPESFVCRVWYGERVCGAEPFLVAATLEEIQLSLERKALVKTCRHPDDDPAIVEVWL